MTLGRYTLRYLPRAGAFRGFLLGWMRYARYQEIVALHLGWWSFELRNR